jgi:hypothetical protein
MNLGTQTSSVVNHLYSRMTKDTPTPTVGMGATVLCWSDRRAATVISVENNIVTVQEDTATRVDDNGMSEDQTYTYAPNPTGYVQHFRIGKDGKFTEVTKNSTTGRWNKQGSSSGLILGFRRQYYDFSF